MGRHSPAVSRLIGVYYRIRWKSEAWLAANLTDLYLLRYGMLRNRIREDKAFLRLHADLCRENIIIQTLRERFNVWQLAGAASRLPGDMAEVGVDRGGSARIISEVKGDKTFHLFDTFGGMPQTEADKDGIFRPGDFAATNVERVRNYLGRYPNLVFHPGFFPDTTKDVSDATQFCFVHLDVDIYKSTRDALHYFYPRMVRGGMILSHDYGQITAPGVKQAYDEFFADKPEPVVALWDTQCLVVKM